MNKYTKIGLGVLLVAIIFTAGRFSKPTKVETKTVTKTETVKVEGKTRVVYRDRVISPDGTITEHEQEREDTNTREESKSSASTENTVTNDVGLTLAALAVKSVKDVGGETGVQIVASKRILGGLNLATSFTSFKDEKLAAVGLGWSF